MYFLGAEFWVVYLEQFLSAKFAFLGAEFWVVYLEQFLSAKFALNFLECRILIFSTEFWGFFSAEFALSECGISIFSAPNSGGSVYCVFSGIEGLQCYIQV